ncbi:hypothetical protein [Streptomyces sp. NPDC002851]
MLRPGAWQRQPVVLRRKPQIAPVCRAPFHRGRPCGRTPTGKPYELPVPGMPPVLLPLCPECSAATHRLLGPSHTHERQPVTYTDDAGATATAPEIRAWCKDVLDAEVAGAHLLDDEERALLSEVPDHGRIGAPVLAIWRRLHPRCGDLRSADR